MATAETSGAKRGALAGVGEWALKIVGLFVILEPIWMLLPFAGFLYGSVLHIQALNRNPSTASLAHFVFPVLTGGWLGPVLVVVGFLVFLIGAGQIYAAKIFKSGLVTRGLYRFVRHPQYIALTLFGVGILLTWGRRITFIAFFAMMFLYYYLAKSEERNCIRLFGEAYERYRKRTSFIIPGDRHLRGLAAKLPKLRLPAAVRVTLAFAVAMAICFAVMWLIQSVSVAGRTGDVAHPVGERRGPHGAAHGGDGSAGAEGGGGAWPCGHGQRGRRRAVRSGRAGGRGPRPIPQRGGSGLRRARAPAPEDVGVAEELPRIPRRARRGRGDRLLHAVREARHAGDAGDARGGWPGGSRAGSRSLWPGPRAAHDPAGDPGAGRDHRRRVRRSAAPASRP